MSYEQLVAALKAAVTEYLSDHIYDELQASHAEYFAVPNYNVTVKVDVFPIIAE